MAQYKCSDVPGLLDCIKREESLPLFPFVITKNTVTQGSTMYKRIQYNKDILSNELIQVYRLCHSLLFNEKNQLVCLSPPKTMLAETFIQQYPQLPDDVSIEEWIEGTTVQLFFDEDWEVVTQECVGDTEIRARLIDAMTQTAMHFDKQKCYSFVLHRDTSTLLHTFFLIAVYEIQHKEDGDIWIMEHSTKGLGFLTTHIHTHAHYIYTSYSQIIHAFGSMNTPYYIKGIVLKKSSTGECCKISNPHFDILLHSNETTRHWQRIYVSLRHIGMVKQYLEEHTSKKNMFSGFRDQIHLYTHMLYQNYIDCFIKKRKQVDEYPEEYQYHMHQLQKKYREKFLPEKGGYINRSIVIQYINQLPPSCLLFWLNYTVRRRNITRLGVGFHSLDE